MENRFLFRAKRKDNGEWIFGNLIQTDDGVYIIQNYVPQHLIKNYEVDQSTVCQCTGLKDKKGKLIWENDIVKDRIYQRTEHLYKVIYDYEEGSWPLGCNSEPLYGIGGANSEKYEVVGNACNE